MRICLSDAGKKYLKQWVFRHITLDMDSGERIVVTGPNGSGKSTLLKLISGALIPTEGDISYYIDDKRIPDELIFRYVTYAAPYLELVEEYSLRELLNFHFGLRKPVQNLSKDEIIKISGLEDAADKYIKYYSSGMKQRLKLSLALLTSSKLIVLDEPLSNLDAAAVSWYKNLIEEYAGNRNIIVGSNHQANEYFFCSKELFINNYKDITK